MKLLSFKEFKQLLDKSCVYNIKGLKEHYKDYLARRNIKKLDK